MSDIRIVCAYDAAKLAETLTRLLEAEQHRVRLSIGRQSMTELQAAQGDGTAVLLIWSPDARSQTYMLEWSRINPIRLIEIALTPDPPRIARKAPVIDFSTWRGQRGERAQWNALNDRLRAVSRALNPPKPPPKYAAFALGVASATAVAGALVLRMHDAPMAPQSADAAYDQASLTDPNLGLGGPLIAVEPASIEDGTLFTPHQFARLAVLPEPDDLRLARMQPSVDVELRDETLLERINALNPLRQLGAGADEE